MQAADDMRSRMCMRSGQALLNMASILGLTPVVLVYHCDARSSCYVSLLIRAVALYLYPTFI